MLIKKRLRYRGSSLFIALFIKSKRSLIAPGPALTNMRPSANLHPVPPNARLSALGPHLLSEPTPALHACR